MKMTITKLNKMLENKQIECLKYTYENGYVDGEYKITELGFKTLDKKTLDYFKQYEIQNHS